MNTNALFFDSGFMMIAAVAGLFLHTHFSMLKRKAIRVRVDNRDDVRKNPHNLR